MTSAPFPNSPNSAELTSFNARWMTPEDVAKTFIPTPHLTTLLKTQHSLLLGPRGCGKTTLLKMLTRRAQETWRARLKERPDLDEYSRPEFEAIYIPSDVRWSYELNSIYRELPTNPILSERVQRAAVSLAALIEAINTFQLMIGHIAQTDCEHFLTNFIRGFHLRNTVPTFSDIRLSLSGLGDALRSSIVRREAAHLEQLVNDLHPSITARAADSLMRACSIFVEFFTEIETRPTRWALCFDELEIAPVWLQTELLESLRSSEQRFLLKLTWSPVLPAPPKDSKQLEEKGRELQEKHQQPQHDFATIKMWNPHASESSNMRFCKRFSSDFIRTKFANPNLTPKMVFGASIFAQEDRVKENEDIYAQGSTVWRSMVELAKRDASFRDFLNRENLDPTNPVSDQVRRRDECLRKIKPIVLLRETYKGTLRARSRKRPTLYAGEEAIYAMSEGNPRLLARLLNELLDFVTQTKKGIAIPVVRREDQAKILTAASRRALSEIKAYPTQSAASEMPHLSNIVDSLGKFLHNQLVRDTFPGDDPVGSFFVDENASEDLVEEISRGLLIGAFIVVGGTSEIPSSITGVRMRLSYMLAPFYKLLFRNYRQIRLTRALQGIQINQPRMF